MREKFWQYMRNPTAKGKAKLTTMEQEFAEKLKDVDECPDNQLRELPKAKPSDPKPKSK
tara:strand:+ start:52 stop:228 length:177 start_codon:yes stop_codon:yes gene_type:complete